MLKSYPVRPIRKLCLAQLCEPLLKTHCVSARAWISCRNGATDTGVAAFEGDFADTKPNHTADFRSEESVLPKGGDAVYFKSSAEAQPSFGNCHSGKPRAHSIKRSSRDDGWAIGNQVVGNAVGFVPDHDWLIKEFAEPRCGGYGVARKSE